MIRRALNTLAVRKKGQQITQQNPALPIFMVESKTGREFNNKPTEFSSFDIILWLNPRQGDNSTISQQNPALPIFVVESKTGRQFNNNPTESNSSSICG